jgi:cation diffusion facilitator family transporter
MAQGSTRVVLAALAGNGAIALAKFGAAWLSGSAAMLTEAVHSLVDTGDQFLLLAGQARGRKAPDESHPLGYGMETYFWSFIVALMVFVLGGVFSVVQGVSHILHPAPVVSPWISLGVLAVAAVFEGASFRIGYREYKAVIRGRTLRGRQVNLWTFIKISKDPSLVSVLLEDSAALIGIVLAAVGVVGATWLHMPWADGAASVAIGLLLAAVAFVLGNETRSLIAGEAVAEPVMVQLKATLAAIDCITELQQIATLHLGPSEILVALTLSFRPQSTTESLNAAIRELTECLKAADGRVAYVYVRPSAEAAAPVS